MTATAARIAFIQQPFRRSIATNTAARMRHGVLARESADPIETFFDEETDAQIMADERLDLLSAERRAFDVDVSGLDDVWRLDATDGFVPIAQYIDEERRCDRQAVILGISMDLANQQAQIIVWG